MRVSWDGGLVIDGVMVDPLMQSQVVTARALENCDLILSNLPAEVERMTLQAFARGCCSDVCIVRMRGPHIDQVQVSVPVRIHSHYPMFTL